MNKLPEAPNRKYWRHIRKEKEPSRQKKESRSFSAVTVGLKTPISFSDAGALRNAEHPFIAIAPRSTLARSGSTW